jgi:Carboxypeptidase regulatory-like domain/TonB dependent receptor-like, beta-barrel
MIAGLIALLLLGATAQAPRDVRLSVTVIDQTGAVIQNATVTVTPLAEPRTPLPTVATGDKGVAVVTGLTPGRYAVQAEFPGFEPRLLRDVQVKPGDNKHVIVLVVQGMQDSVTVTRDAREAASDRRTTFGTALTREQIEALSDDPDEMAQQLQNLAGGNAVIRVDSFEGGRLPPKAAIKAIHITRDAFAAENHFAGGLFIDIITQPGIGPLRTNVNMRLRAGSLSGKNELATAKGPERTQNYNGGLSGSLIRQKASFSVNVNTLTQFETPVYYLKQPDGSLVNSLGPRRPTDNVYIFGLFDYAITRDQTLRLNFSRYHSKASNLGIGGYDRAERGFSNEENGNTLRIQEAGPVGRRFFINTRASIGWSDTAARSIFEGPTIRVLDEFTAGGQQQTGGVRRKTINLQSDLDYVRGRHSVRTGLQLDGGVFHSDDATNYFGTYTFESMDAYLAGTPRTFTRRDGNPNIDYKNIQAGVYLQDDIRVRKNLTLSPGIRYELQTHLDDVNNFGPRFGITWSPGKSGKTTLRASAGVFYDWLTTGTYEQTLRVDGFRQRELNINNPLYPNPGNLGPTTPANRYLLSDDLQMQRFTRLSAGFDRAVTSALRVNATYAHTSGDSLMRGLNLNAPVNGLRPDPNFANVVQVVDDAESRQNTLNIGATFNLNALTPGPVMIGGGGGMIRMMGAPPPPPPPPGGPNASNPANRRWNWRRLNVFTNIGFGRQMNNTEGAFATPATGLLFDDWGPAIFDIRRRFNLGIVSTQLRNLNANININMASAPPYTVRTGTDDNHDLVLNDRPAGVGRNTLRASSQWTINGFFNYGWTFGKPVERPGGISFRTEGGALAASQGAAQTTGRYRLSLNVNVQNLTNHGNLTGYSGVLTSSNFGQPTSVLGTRKVDIGLGLSF